MVGTAQCTRLLLVGKQRVMLGTLSRVGSDGLNKNEVQ